MTLAVELENAGSAAWVSRGPGEGVHASYHWLDERGNAIVWDGLRTPLERPVAPGETRRLELRLRGPIPPGRYRLALDLVEEGRFWFAELGSRPLELDVDVRARIRRALAVLPAAADDGVAAALAAQEESLVDESEAEAVAYLGPGCEPAPDWSGRVLDAHQEGYAVVGGSVEPVGGLLRRRRLAKRLAPWAPGTGRLPRFDDALLCPSIVRGLDARPSGEVEGLPALEPPDDEPWLFDGRIAIRVRV